MGVGPQLLFPRPPLLDLPQRRLEQADVVEGNRGLPCNPTEQALMLDVILNRSGQNAQRTARRRPRRLKTWPGQLDERY